MEESAAGRRGQFRRPAAHRRRPVPDDGDDRNGVLDRGLALREPALRGRADDVRAAVLQPVLLPVDGEGLPGTGDHLPHLRDDPAVEHRVLPAAVVRPGLDEVGFRRQAGGVDGIFRPLSIWCLDAPVVFLRP